MTKSNQVVAALKSLGGDVKNLIDNASAVSDGVAPDIRLLASHLAALGHNPPTLKTKDFDYPRGEEEVLPAADNAPGAVFERLIDETDLLPVWFLQQGAQIQRSVARVVLTKPHAGFPPGTGWATGFLVSPDLLLTNNHVIPEQAFASKIRFQFNYQLGPDGIEQPTESFLPAAGGTFRTSEPLDYTLIRLQPNPPGKAGGEPTLPGDRWGVIPLNGTPTFREQQHFNIIQHPAGRRKEVALQDNEFAKLFPNVVLYESDTEPGSSGSPVLDNVWQLVALHHAGGERHNGKWQNNEGIRIDRIVEDLQQHFTSTGEAHILRELRI